MSGSLRVALVCSVVVVVAVVLFLWRFGDVAVDGATLKPPMTATRLVITDGHSIEEDALRHQIQPQIAVAVVDAETGHPLSTASMKKKNEHVLFAATAIDGIARLERQREAVELVVSCEGYEDLAWCITPDCPAIIVLEMQSAAVLQGKVIADWPLRIDDEYYVVAWPAGPRADWPTIEQVLDGMKGNGSVCVTSVDADGTFLIKPKVKDVPHYIIAAGGGLVSFMPDTILAEAGQRDITLTLRPVFGLWLRIEDASGGVPILSKDLFRSGIEVGFEMRYGSISQDDLRLWLAGFEGSAINVDDQMARCTFVVADTQVSHLPMATVQIALPGYFALPKKDVPFRFLGDGLQAELIIVTRCVAGFGELLVTFGCQNPAWLDARNTVANGMRVYLTNKDVKDRSKIWLTIRAAEGNVVRLRDLPFGDYYVTIVDWGNIKLGRNEDVWEVTISEEPAKIDLSYVEWSCLEIDLLGLDGVPWSGPAHFSIGHVFRADGAIKAVPYFFTTPPYRIPVTRFGQYGGYCYSPWKLVMQDGGLTTFDVVAGTKKQLKVQAGVDRHFESNTGGDDR